MHAHSFHAVPAMMAATVPKVPLVEAGGAQGGSLARRQCRLQVLLPTDLDEPPQGPCPAPQPLHVDRLAGEEPEPVPDYLLRRRRAGSADGAVAASSGGGKVLYEVGMVRFSTFRLVYIFS
jgi:hypothetical protein